MKCDDKHCVWVFTSQDLVLRHTTPSSSKATQVKQTKVYLRLNQRWFKYQPSWHYLLHCLSLTALAKYIRSVSSTRTSPSLSFKNVYLHSLRPISISFKSTPHPLEKGFVLRVANESIIKFIVRTLRWITNKRIDFNFLLEKKVL